MVYAVAENTYREEDGMRRTWKLVAAVFLTVLLVAAGVTIERATSQRRKEITQYAPSGFGEVRRSTYTITETSGQYTRPRELVRTSNWRVVDLSDMGLALAVPDEWSEERAADPGTIRFIISSKFFGSKRFIVSFRDNPQRYDLREFLWKEVLGGEALVTDGVREGEVELLGSWLIDGVEGFSLYKKEGESGEYLALPHQSGIIVFHAEDLRFTPANKDLFTVLSTVKLQI